MLRVYPATSPAITSHKPSGRCGLCGSGIRSVHGGARADAAARRQAPSPPLPARGTTRASRALPAMAASKSRSRKTFDGPTAEEKIVASLIELMEAGSAPWRRPGMAPEAATTSICSRVIATAAPARSCSPSACTSGHQPCRSGADLPRPGSSGSSPARAARRFTSCGPSSTAARSQALAVKSPCAAGPATGRWPCSMPPISRAIPSPA